MGLRVGSLVDLNLTEIELDALARVQSIDNGPEVVPGDGAVVTGRFATRRANNLVRVTFEDGTQLTGTENHPVWCVDDADWRPLGEFTTGLHVQTRNGMLAVNDVEALTAMPPVYNIEVDHSHAYEVTLLGILVHNVTVDSFDCDRYTELFIKRHRGLEKLTDAEREEFGGLLKDIREINWGSWYRGIAGEAPPELADLSAHAHHILFKSGRGAQKELVAEGMEILVDVGINPIKGKANLVWAPNIKGQHTTEALQNVVDKLRAANASGSLAERKFAVEAALEELGRKAARLR